MAKVFKRTYEEVKEIFDSYETEILANSVFDNFHNIAILLECIEDCSSGHNYSTVLKCSNCKHEFEITSTTSYLNRVTCPHCKCNHTKIMNSTALIQDTDVTCAIKLDVDTYLFGSIKVKFSYDEEGDITETKIYPYYMSYVENTTKSSFKRKDPSKLNSEMIATTTRLDTMYRFASYYQYIAIGFDTETTYSDMSTLVRTLATPATKKAAAIEIPSECYDTPPAPEISDIIGIATKVQERNVLNHTEAVRCKCLICEHEWLFERKQYESKTLECPYCGTAERENEHYCGYNNYNMYISDCDDYAEIKIVSYTYTKDTLEPEVNAKLVGYYKIFANKKNKPIGFINRYSHAWNPSRYDSVRNTFSISEVKILSATNLLKYTGIEEFIASCKDIRYGINSRDILMFIVNALKYPVVEKTAKLGLSLDYLDYYSNYNPVEFNLKATSVHEAFGISKALLKYYRKHKDMYDKLTMQQLQKLYKLDNTLNGDEIYWACREDVDINAFQNVQRVLPEMSISRMITYLERVRLSQMFKPRPAIAEWRDYLEACKSLKMDMHDNHVLYPKALKTEHDIVVAKQRFVMDESVREDFNKAVEEYKELEYHRDDWFIKVPDSLESMFEEGRKLNHCCGRYVDDVARKQAFVLFLRRKDNPDEPFLSIEVSPDKKVKQVRGKNDSYIYVLPDYRDISLFLTHWAKMKHLTLEIE